MKIADKIKKYSVKIEYTIIQGSGVIVKSQNRHYLMTAKHNFKTNQDDRNRVNTKSIVIDKIKIVSEYFEEIKIEKIIYHYEDFLIFLIDGEISNLDEIEILEQGYNDDFNYFAIGYPVEKQDSHLFKIDTRVDKDDNFTLRNIDHNRLKSMKGASGTGVFAEYNNILYLSGIMLEYISDYSDIKNFNLSKFVKKINEELIKQELAPLKIKESNLYIKEIPNMYDWILKTHTDNFLVQKTKSLLGEEAYTNLPNINTGEKLEELFDYMMRTNEFFKLEDKYTQKIADMYLLGAFISSRYNNDNTEAVEYLKRAIRFRSEYIIFLAEIDKENSKEELFKEGKLAYLEEKYEFSKNCFEKLLSLCLERVEKIEVYEYLIKISKKLERQKETIPFYLKLLNLYNEDLEKATVYYELSLIESKDKSKLYASQGIAFIRYSSYWEILYLLYKRLYELTEEKDVYLMLKSILEKLVQHKTKYKYELSTLNYSETLDKIGIGTYLSSFILLILSLFFISSNWRNPIIIPITTILFTLIMHFFYKVKGVLLFLNNFIFLGGGGSLIFYLL